MQTIYEDVLLGSTPEGGRKAVGWAEEEATMQCDLPQQIAPRWGCSSEWSQVGAKGARPLGPHTHQSLDDHCPGGGLTLGKATSFSQEQSWLMVEGPSWQIPNSEGDTLHS